jgi:hypothetical protein
MKRTSQTIVAAVALALAGSALARTTTDPFYYDYAHVVRVDRIVAPGDQPVSREECWKEPVVGTSYHDTAPTSVVKTTTVSEDGVVRTDVVRTEEMKTTDTQTDPHAGYQEKCRVKTDYAQAPQILGYDVVYNYHNEDYHDRMSRDPGSQVRVRVRDGYVNVVE